MFRAEKERLPPLYRAQYDPALESPGPDIAAMNKAASDARQDFQLKSRLALIGA